MFCRNCGQELPEGTKFCTGCGSKIGMDPYQSSPYQPYQNYGTEPQRKSYKGLIIGLIIAAAAVVVVLVILFMSGFFSMGGIRGGNTASSQDAAGDESASSGTSWGGGSAYDDYDNYSIEYVSCDVSAYPNVKVYCRILDEYGNLVTLDNPEFSISEYENSGRAIEKIVKRVNQLDGKEGLCIKS